MLKQMLDLIELHGEGSPQVIDAANAFMKADAFWEKYVVELAEFVGTIGRKATRAQRANDRRAAMQCLTVMALLAAKYPGSVDFSD